MDVISSQEQYITITSGTAALNLPFRYITEDTNTIPRKVYAFEIYDVGESFNDKRFWVHYSEDKSRISTYSPETKSLLREVILRNNYSCSDMKFPDISRVKENLEILDEIRKCEEDWSGNKIGKIPPIIISIAYKIITSVVHQPAVYPTGRKTIHMEYNRTDKSYLEFEIFEDKIRSMEVPKREYKKAKFRQISLNSIDLISQIVEDFHADS